MGLADGLPLGARPVHVLTMPCACLPAGREHAYSIRNSWFLSLTENGAGRDEDQGVDVLTLY